MTDREKGRWRYPHMCRDEHQEIGHRDSEHEMCPLCVALSERDDAFSRGRKHGLQEAANWITTHPSSTDTNEDREYVAGEIRALEEAADGGEKG